MISVLQEAPEQGFALPDKLFVSEALDLYSSFYTDPADWWLLVKTRGLDSQKHERFKKLSGGQKQRLSVALALVGNPRFAVLDELTTGLHPEAAGTPGISSRGSGIVALDTPAALAESIHAGMTMRFPAPETLDGRLRPAHPADVPEGVITMTRRITRSR